MLQSVRSAAAIVLAFAFLAGPVSAMCLHGADHGMDTTEPMEHVPMGHEMPEHAPADEMPPCHDVPDAPVPADPPPVDGCASACCTAEAVMEDPAPLPSTEAVALLAVVVTETLAEPAVAWVPAPSPSPPRSPARLHVVLERFLI